MSRLPLVEVEQMTREQKAQYDRFPSNLSRGILLLDDRLASVLPSLANALRTSALDPKQREAVVLRVAALHDSAYERMQHLEQAHKVGWSDVEVAAIEKGSAAVRDPSLASLLRFVEACVEGTSVLQRHICIGSRGAVPSRYRYGDRLGRALHDGCALHRHSRNSA